MFLKSCFAAGVSAFAFAAVCGVPAQAQTYVYDDRGRLKSVTYTDCSQVVFNYDLQGNRTSRNVTAAGCGGANQAPVWTSGTAASVVENQTPTGYTATATDPESAPVSYSIAGGLDQALFTVNSTSGVLSFLSAPNFEAPGDSDGNNVYDVTLRASDGALTADRAVAITVTDDLSDNNTAPSWTSGTTASINENQTVTSYIATATDAQSDPLTFSIVGGADQAAFAINTSSGVLSFVAAPDFEAPTDAGGNNIYDVTLRVSDGALSADRSVAVSVTDVADGNSPPDAVNDTTHADAGVAEDIYVLINDSDPDGDPLTITSVSSTLYGTVQIIGNFIRYTPFGFTSGTHTFTYTISDGNGGTDTATISVIVNPGMPL
ncbi:Ig-like domain-containing protein [Maricaulis sp.]|uniref:Ig-like domain-containing protein n=1 Tax=Maricaulis sp. TaxID=1486257 RepID=UPI00261B26DC|nr:Ig-like domain-containing protein [Maricaulis sp.]